MTMPDMAEGGQHVNELRLAAYLDRRLGAAERDAVENHLAACADCRNDVVEGAAIMARSRRRRQLFAAGGLLAVAASLVLIVRTAGPDVSADTTYRSGGDSPAVVAYGPIGPVTGTSLRFVWAPVTAAASYRVTLTRLDGTLLWSSSVRDTAAALADSVHLTPGERYFWIADALLADGGVRTTGPREFQIEP